MIQPVPIESDRANSESDDMYLNPTSIHAALASAVREARLRHKLLGQPVVEWQNGRVVLVPPEEIEIVEPTSVQTTQPSMTSNELRTP